MTEFKWYHFWNKADLYVWTLGEGVKSHPELQEVLTYLRDCERISPDDFLGIGNMEETVRLVREDCENWDYWENGE